MRFLNRVKLQTPESVELEFALAGIGSRALALLIDYHLLGAIWIVFLILWGFLSAQVVDLVVQTTGSTQDLELWLLALTLLVSFALYVGYFVAFETLWQGQTPGKRLTKIRVICEDGRPARLAQATLRALLRPIDDTLFIGMLLIILTPREKRLGDWVAGTLVVQNQKPLVKTGVQLSERAHAIAQQLSTIADISRLLPDDFAIIREYLQRRSLLAPKAKSELNLKLARQVKAIIALDTLPQDMTPDDFLEAIYLAYQQQSQQR